MSVLVKMPHIEIEIKGEDSQKVIDLLKSSFSNVKVINEKSVDIDTTDWNRNSAVLVTLLGNQIPLISNYGFILASVPVFFGLAWFCTGQMYLNSKRFAFIIPLIVISFSLGANMRGETRSLELCCKNL
jgi:hypothetical protein